MTTLARRISNDLIVERCECDIEALLREALTHKAALASFT